MGNFIRLLYNANRIFANVFSVKFINNDNLKNEKKDCKSKITIKPKAIFFSALLVVDEGSLPIYTELTSIKASERPSIEDAPAPM